MRIKLKNVRIAFCEDLFKPGRFQDKPENKLRYSATFILRNDDPQIEKIRAALLEAAEKKWPGKGEKKIKPNDNTVAIITAEILLENMVEPLARKPSINSATSSGLGGIK